MSAEFMCRRSGMGHAIPQREGLDSSEHEGDRNRLARSPSRKLGAGGGLVVQLPRLGSQSRLIFSPLSSNSTLPLMVSPLSFPLYF
jgi:hypothetical protein